MRSDPSGVSVVSGWAPAGHRPAIDGQGLLAVFNRSGVLAAADVHVAATLQRLAGETDEVVALAAALAVRAPRVGHVAVDLLGVRDVAAGDLGDDLDVSTLPWPQPSTWVDRVAASQLVAGEGSEQRRPLRLAGSVLYLDRYWRDELAVAGELVERSAAVTDLLGSRSGGALERLFPDDGDQRRAARLAAGRLLTVLVGGPGTGKTTTVARLLALLHLQADHGDARPPLIGLSAPTGKAAARLEEAVRSEALRLDIPPSTRVRLASTPGLTLHRLLGYRPGSSSRFRYHRGLRLPHDVIVVDEASMVSLGMMARLLEAVRPDARLVLVGDPDQLVSVEAGAVLADVVGPALVAGGDGPGAGAGGDGPGAGAGGEVPDEPAIGRSIAVLSTNHRFGGALTDLATAVRAGHGDDVIRLLGEGPLDWIDVDPAVAGDDALGELRDLTLGWAWPMVEAARSGDSVAALEAMRGGRLLCAHREGEAGAGTWNARVVSWVVQREPAIAAEGTWYAGRPVMLTTNDYGLRLFNGDAGVVVAGGGAGPVRGSELVVAFEGRTQPVRPGRLAQVETVYAMTVHKSQGSEFDRVALVLPPPGSRLLTRELMYTAVTRARHHLLVVGSEVAIRLAVSRPIARASGLTARLWGPAPNPTPDHRRSEGPTLPGTQGQDGQVVAAAGTGVAQHGRFDRVGDGAGGRRSTGDRRDGT